MKAASRTEDRVQYRVSPRSRVQSFFQRCVEALGILPPIIRRQDADKQYWSIDNVTLQLLGLRQELLHEYHDVHEISKAAWQSNLLPINQRNHRHSALALAFVFAFAFAEQVWTST
ncbi:hypothetical protein SODALDRAFT_355373 [Sodiomyces alkalinus F11]|uniref:Uncharacterized protein n=1 Tax=Sodiomyces alkalinus (strain CBS 110278 / VKM F-3762 / F11) TaxID=1314773 RepID=A0A3N2Q954_SODAK|nr:hypothetical protein SODALDRAFT_355373 [Sodiomyces alkalinus F11]ROT43178.1 hypothetical protein SODALDRAFT_355373 [Sodiomyces alkalinus F11]